MRKQAIRYTLSGVVGIVLAVALTVMVNWLGARHYACADWTTSKIYSLSDKTRNIVGELDEDIRVIVFMTPASPLYDQVSELLNRYAAVSPKINVEYIDPDREPLKTRQLAEQFGISVANTVVFSYADRTKYVTSDQMADYDYCRHAVRPVPDDEGLQGRGAVHRPRSCPWWRRRFRRCTS